MKLIKLSNGWKVKPDGAGWALVQTRLGKSKDGAPKEHEIINGYFARLDRALTEYADEMAKDAASVDDAITILRQCLSDIERVAKETNNETD